jgi:Ser/Thr protein kinase RdoA (MazF antagonist)
VTTGDRAQPAAAAAASAARRQEQLRSVARRALARFDFPPDAALAPVSERENAIFRIDDPTTGRAFALRVHRRGYQSRPSVRSELQWMEALRQAGVETPVPRRGADGELVQVVAAAEGEAPYLCDVLAWLEGSPLAASDSPDVLRTLGALNARIHRQARAWRLPEGFERQRWDEDGMLGARPLWGDYRELALLGSRERALLERAAARVHERLRRHGQTPDRFGLIHADLMPENILVCGGEPCVIDFDDCGFGWFLYDLATLLCFDAGLPSYDDRLAAWLAGYRSVQSSGEEQLLGEEQLAELPTLVMARILVSLGWLHTRRDTDFARAVTELAVGRACAYAEQLLSSSWAE